MDKAKETKVTHSKPKKNTTKIVSIVVVAVIITFLVAAGIFLYLPKQIRAQEIHTYKKEAYAVMQCQYSCPLSEQVIQNVSVLFPSQECLKACSDSLTTHNYSDKYSVADLLKDDNFVNDVSTILNTCKQSSLVKAADSNSTNMLDNRKYFKCVTDSLTQLETKYPYLKK